MARLKVKIVRLEMS